MPDHSARGPELWGFRGPRRVQLGVGAEGEAEDWGLLSALTPGGSGLRRDQAAGRLEGLASRGR